MAIRTIYAGLMHTIQWSGADAGWSPADDFYVVSVSFAHDDPAVIDWLGAHLGSWLRQAFDTNDWRVRVPPAQQGGAPMTSITIEGMKAPLPDPPALRVSIEEAIARAEHEVSNHQEGVDAYIARLRQLPENG